MLLILIAYLLANSNASRGLGTRSFTHGVLYYGKCSVSNAWSTILGILINLLSTAMLAASNYCTQCLSAPSRADVDRAHAQKIWLGIGTFSVKNLLLRSLTYRTLWLLLHITSTPIHLELVFL